MISETILRTAAFFRLPSLPEHAEAVADGHINRTYKITCADGSAFILQRINTDIFTDPEGLTANIIAVTDFIREKLAASGGDAERGTLTLIETANGGYLYHSDDGYYRMYRAITGARSYNKATPALFENAARAFGHFQRLLDDFPADSLCETIPDFHNTAKRYGDFIAALERDTAGRAGEVAAEVDFIRAHRGLCNVVTDKLAAGELPLRVTHNDTKLNNIMMDDATGEGICVVDLDTVMPGSLLYDFGDAIRFGASTAAEDEPELSRVSCDLAMYECFTRGFLSETAGTLTRNEAELLPESAMLLTLECGMRFLGDYLSGDTYFAVSRPGQNLDRARTQLKLVADMEGKLGEMRAITARYTGNIH